MWPFYKKTTYTLTPTQELLLALLRAQLWLKPVDYITLPSSMEEWDNLLNLGYKQTVVCFIAAACLRHKDVNNIPADIREELAAVIEENAKIHEQHNAILIELITKFEEQGLHPILLKGQGLAQIYDCVEPDSSISCEPDGNSSFFILHSSLPKNSVLRQCGDIDLYFRSDEYEQAKAYILSIEDRIEKRHAEKYHHFESQYRGITIEIHRHTGWIPNPFANKRYLKFEEEEMMHPSEKTIGGKNINIPSPLFNLVSVFVHMWNHFENRGVSLRQMCDVMMMIHYYKDAFTKEQHVSTLKSISFMLPWHVIGCVLIDHIGLSQMGLACYAPKYEERANMMLRIIFNDGAFNFGKHKDEYANMSKLRRRVALHINGHREFMKVYPVTGSRILWRYAAFKKCAPYRFLNWLCGHN